MNTYMIETRHCYQSCKRRIDIAQNRHTNLHTYKTRHCYQPSNALNVHADIHTRRISPTNEVKRDTTINQATRFTHTCIHTKRDSAINYAKRITAINQVTRLTYVHTYIRTYIHTKSDTVIFKQNETLLSI